MTTDDETARRPAAGVTRLRCAHAAAIGAASTRPARGLARHRGHAADARPRCSVISCALVRICLVYDCLFPYTVGGAERWYRNLAERLAADGHEVTYLTLRQWEPGDPPADPGRARGRRSGRGSRSTADGGRRRIGPPLRLRRRRAAAPAAPRPPLRRRPHRLVPVLLAARRGGWRGRCGALPARRRLARGLDAASTGASTSGGVGGRIGWRCSARCVRVPPARVLLLAPARRAAARGGAARRGRRCSRASYAGLDLTPRRAACRPSRWSSSPAATSPRSARRRSSPAIAPRRASACPTCAA